MGTTVKKKSTREAYGEALVEIGESNPDVVVLDADLASSTRTSKFASRFPERFFDVGIAEQNLMGVAAGLAVCGKIPFASTFAVFAVERAFNQIKQNIAYPGLNVKIAPSHAGLSACGDGASHQSLIDVSLMRALPNMTVFVPSDATQTVQAVRAAVQREGPVYIRLGKTDVPVIFDPRDAFEPGKALVLREGTDVTVVVTGVILSQAMEAAEALSREGISVRLVNMHTVKPIDRGAIVESAQKTGRIVTVEEHSTIGGLGSAVSEVLAEECPVVMRMIGVRDCFGESATEEELYRKHGMTPEAIAETLRKVVTQRERHAGHAARKER